MDGHEWNLGSGFSHRPVGAVSGSRDKGKRGVRADGRKESGRLPTKEPDKQAFAEQRPGPGCDGLRARVHPPVPGELFGVARWDDDLEPVTYAGVCLYELGGAESNGRGVPLGVCRTDEQGRFGFGPLPAGPAEGSASGVRRVRVAITDVWERAIPGLLIELPTAAQSWEVSLLVPAAFRASPERRGAVSRPRVRVGAFLLDAVGFEALDPEGLLDIVRLQMGRRLGRGRLDRIESLCPGLDPKRVGVRGASTTPILRTVTEIVRLKGWRGTLPSDVDAILASFDRAVGHACHESASFVIHHGTGEATERLARLATALEAALERFTAPPFRFERPDDDGKVPVYLNHPTFGGATAHLLTLSPSLDMGLLEAVACCELFHLLQARYGSPPGSWQSSLLDGGALLASVDPDAGGQPGLHGSRAIWNGHGFQTCPNLPLEEAGYDAALFWRYLCEQHAHGATGARIDPAVYRTILECARIGGSETAAIARGTDALPWNQDFCSFRYSEREEHGADGQPGREDAAEPELESTETTFGNFALACYLDRLGGCAVDSRFRFERSSGKVATARLSGTGALMGDTALTFAGAVERFATRYYEATVDPTVDSVRLRFRADADLRHHLVQVALIDEHDRVRDISRSDRRTWTKQLANRGRHGRPKRIARIVVAVSGTESRGGFTLALAPAEPAPDVAVTRWNCRAGEEHEVDSRRWGWTWTSPDLWLRRPSAASPGAHWIALRLHNKGNRDARGVSARFWYRDPTRPGRWIVARGTDGEPLSLDGLTLGAGTSGTWSVRWAPPDPALVERHALRVEVSAPGDPNTDNKIATTTGGWLHVPRGRCRELHWERVNRSERRARIDLALVPRFPLLSPYAVSHRSRSIVGAEVLEPGDRRTDRLLVCRGSRPKISAFSQVVQGTFAGRTHDRPTAPFEPSFDGCWCPDPGLLPPPLAGSPLLTIIHREGGRCAGGATVAIC